MFNFLFQGNLGELIAPIQSPEQQLLIAIQNRQHDKIHELLEVKRVPAGCSNDKGVTPIHMACQMGQRELVQRLLDRGANANAVDRAGNTVLHFAARGGSVEMTQWAVMQGIRPETRNSSGASAYDVAADHMVRQYLLPLQLQAEAPADQGTTTAPAQYDYGAPPQHGQPMHQAHQQPAQQFAPSAVDALMLPGGPIAVSSSRLSPQHTHYAPPPAVTATATATAAATVPPPMAAPPGSLSPQIGNNERAFGYPGAQPSGQSQPQPPPSLPVPGAGAGAGAVSAPLPGASRPGHVDGASASDSGGLRNAPNAPVQFGARVGQHANAQHAIPEAAPAPQPPAPATVPAAAAPPPVVPPPGHHIPTLHKGQTPLFQPHVPRNNSPHTHSAPPSQHGNPQGPGGSLPTTPSVPNSHKTIALSPGRGVIGKTVFKPDGFHSSASDKELQKRYGHTKIVKNVAPPPTMSQFQQQMVAPPAPGTGMAHQRQHHPPQQQQQQYMGYTAAAPPQGMHGGGYAAGGVGKAASCSPLSLTIEYTAHCSRS
ncbi:unnamed protein product [Chrysoparadoxa australica]